MLTSNINVVQKVMA